MVNTESNTWRGGWSITRVMDGCIDGWIDGK